MVGYDPHNGDEGVNGGLGNINNQSATSIGLGQNPGLVSDQYYQGQNGVTLQEPELTFIINKYSLPRGLNSTKKFVEVTDSEHIFLEEQRRQRIETFSKI